MKNAAIVPLITALFLSSCGGSDSNETNLGINQQSAEITELGTTLISDIFYPEFDPLIYHYASNCADESPISYEVKTNNPISNIYINNQLITGPNFEVNNLTLKQDIEVKVSLNRREKRYFIHCITSEFPTIEVLQKKDSVDKGFILLAPRVTENDITYSYLLIIDNYGVPRFREKIEGRIADFKRHVDGRYSYAMRTGKNTFNFWDNDIVILNSSLEEENRINTIGLSHTDNHDFLITMDGTFLLMSYDSSYRDLSAFGLSSNELTRDSVIQEISSDGNLLFEWNSWDHMDINDCTQHRFPDDYAHINSIQEYSDGDIVASFRGCSQILKINRSTGNVVWKLGGSNPDYEITGDAYEEFCGQHTASLFGNRIYIFDNGGHCLGEREAQYGNFTRAVEYELDNTSNQAVFVRDYSLNGSYTEYTSSGGSLDITNNGNWLINWGRGPDASISEINEFGEIALEIKVTKDSEIARTYRAYREGELVLPVNVPIN